MNSELMQRLFTASPFLAEACSRNPQWDFAPWHAQRTAMETASRIGEACVGCESEDQLKKALRERRQHDMARIVYRDLGGLALLDETLHDLSDLADACCEAALQWSMKALTARYGTPRAADGREVRAVILGMGKLGGRELNFSSDIDLIFCHTQGGETDGPGAIGNEQFFARLSQQVCGILSARTEHGFVFRTDTMLRPFGSAGPVSIHFDAAEDYYQQHGREWERYALVKARPVAGDIAAGLSLLERLRPFVYRRYLDFNAIGSLRELKRMIASEVARKGRDDNIKLGTGGIRELEFIVQSFQLVRGGQESRLRDARLRPVLRYLGEAGHLPGQTAAELDRCYVFLRRVENAIQMYGDDQTHAVPTHEAVRAALCAALEFENWAALTKELESVRATVHEEFQRVFAEPPGVAEPQSRFASICDGNSSATEAVALLRAHGYIQSPEDVFKAVTDLQQSRLARGLSESAANRLRALLPRLLEQSSGQADPETAALRVLEVVQAIAGRSTYLTLLHDSQIARAQLVRLCAASPWIARLLAQTPALLDALLDPRSLYEPPTREQMRAELAALFADIVADDIEAGMDALRRYRQETTLRIVAADVAGSLPLVKVSDRLTWLAETVLQTGLARALAELRMQHGEVLRADGSVAGFAVIAYGKFGGIEMGYGSDLDLVFLHDCDAMDGETAGGARAISPGIYFSRLAQRLIHWLSTLTPAGRAYEVDLELRPSGQSGLPVVSLKGFAEYQRTSAWTWEHQALTRARFVAGTTSLGEAFETLRREVLCQPRDPEKLRTDVLAMREKMHAKLERRAPGCWDVKQGEGGLIDIEFITQYLVLRDAHRDPQLVAWSDNWRQLEALATQGVLDDPAKDTLIESYRNLRAWTHQRALQEQGNLAPLAQFPPAQREAVIALWRRVFGLV